MLLPITETTKKRRENKFIRLMFWPGHSPDLNPIWFHIFKEGSSYLVVLSIKKVYRLIFSVVGLPGDTFDITGLRKLLMLKAAQQRRYEDTKRTAPLTSPRCILKLSVPI